MISIKSAREIELMREAGRIVALAHQAVASYIKAGVSVKDIDALVEKVIRDNNAIPSFINYHGYPSATCISINEVVVHGIPDHRIIKEGDIVSVDIGAKYKGYHGDGAWTYAVGDISAEAQKVMDVAKTALFKGIELVKAGIRTEDISAVIGDYIYSNNCTTPLDFSGHGIGTQLHEDPIVANYGVKGRGPKLKAGMVICIEPMVLAGKEDVKILKDGWTVVTKDKRLSAHYEHTILVTEEGYEILTTLQKEKN